MPVQVSTLYVTDVYCHSNLRPYQVGALAYVIPSSETDDCIIICINLVLTMGWVDPPKYFCEFSETLTDLVNELVHRIFIIVKVNLAGILLLIVAAM